MTTCDSCHREDDLTAIHLPEMGGYEGYLCDDCISHLREETEVEVLDLDA